MASAFKDMCLCSFLQFFFFVDTETFIQRKESQTILTSPIHPKNICVASTRNVLHRLSVNLITRGEPANGFSEISSKTVDSSGLRTEEALREIRRAHRHRR